MGWLTKAIITAISAFAATNIDDIIILMFFFSQVDANFCIRHVVIGQYLGFSALVILSLVGFLGGLMIPETWIGLLGFVPIGIGISQLFNPEEDEAEVQTVSKEVNQRSPMSSLANLLNPQVYSVAAVTFANGGDNIGIYVPLFAQSKLLELLVILAIFFIMIAVWCSLAYFFTRHRLIALAFTRYGKQVVPFVLISLGVFIIIDSKSYELLSIFQH